MAYYLEFAVRKKDPNNFKLINQTWFYGFAVYIYTIHSSNKVTYFGIFELWFTQCHRQKHQECDGVFCFAIILIWNSCSCPCENFYHRWIFLTLFDAPPSAYWSRTLSAEIPSKRDCIILSAIMSFYMTLYPNISPNKMPRCRSFFLLCAFVFLSYRIIYRFTKERKELWL